MLRHVLLMAFLVFFVSSCKKKEGYNVAYDQVEQANSQSSLIDKQIVLQKQLSEKADPIVPFLIDEYKSVSKSFFDKGSVKQSSYFDSKLDDVAKTGLVEFEIVPNDVLSDTKNPRLQNLYEKESVVKSIISDSKDDKFKARIIAIYDCAVVDVAESVISSQPEKTSCYDDLNTLTFTVPVSSTEVLKKPVSASESPESQIISRAMTLEKLKPYTEQVNKNFFVIEFEPASNVADISYYDKFKSVSEILNKYQEPYKVTIVGYQLYDEKATKSVKKHNGKIIEVKRSLKAIRAAENVNKTLKTRALTVRKMLVTNGIPDENIVIAHPEPDKVKYLYNVKDGSKGENVLENIVIVDVKLDV